MELGMTIPIIIQVTRIYESFQGRCFRELDGISVLESLIGRIKTEYGSEIMIATSDREEDRVFDEIADKQRINIFHGSLRNIVGRLLGAAESFKEENFVRVYATYPLLDIEEMKRLVQKHVEYNCEYSYNEHNEGVLWGTGCEVFSKSLLKKLDSMHLSDSIQDTIGFYLRQNDHLYRVLRHYVRRERPSYKMCLETAKDMEVIREIYQNVPAVNNLEIIRYMEGHKVLSEYSMEQPAQEIGIEKLFLHPRKLDGLFGSGDVDNSYPISVELSLTNQCNLNCVYCSDMELRKYQGIGSQLDIKVLRNLFSELKQGGTEGIVIEGGGEPTLYPHFDEAVMYAGQVGLAVGLITNGTRKLNDSLLEKFEWIRVSLDATTGEEYEAIKGVDQFETVLKNIADYAKICRTVGVGFVVTKNNISQIENLVMRLRELKVSYIQLRPVVDCEELYPYGVDLEYLKCYQTPEYAVETGGMRENAQAGNENLPCLAHSITTVISADGSVYLCGRLNIYDWIPPIGNINQNSFDTIWNSEERAKQAKMVLNKEFCSKNCPQCRVSKFNQLLHRVAKIHSRHFI